MIIDAKMIEMPISGQYDEHIFDVESAWNTADWCWIRFEDDSCEPWCGEFRGSYIAVAISQKYGLTVVLTSNYIYFLDSSSKAILEVDENYQYNSLFSTPYGDILFNTDYELAVLKGRRMDSITEIPLPFKPDFLKFKTCNDGILKMSCEKLYAWDISYEILLDCKTLTVVKCNKI